MNPAQHLLRVLIRGYQILVSPVLPGGCRYAPSCSDYALEAITRHGAAKGALLAIGRIARCHPWGGHGHDPVPQTIPPSIPPSMPPSMTLFRQGRVPHFPSVGREGDGHG